MDDNGQIKSKEYANVKGFFAPTKYKPRVYYTDEVGMFEQFLIRASMDEKKLTLKTPRTL
jgi:hypothetical protein